jgi:hypothetical protein
MGRKYLLTQRAVDKINKAVKETRKPRLIIPQKRSPKNLGGATGTAADEVHIAYCAEPAPAATVIGCYLDGLIDQGNYWEYQHHYNIGDAVRATGAGTTAYICIKEHTAGYEDKPPDGPNWQIYWVHVTIVNVNCTIAGGGNLDNAVPRLTIGTPLFVKYFNGVWWCLSLFQASESCLCVEPE